MPPTGSTIRPRCQNANEGRIPKGRIGQGRLEQGLVKVEDLDGVEARHIVVVGKSFRCKDDSGMSQERILFLLCINVFAGIVVVVVCVVVVMSVVTAIAAVAGIVDIVSTVVVKGAGGGGGGRVWWRRRGEC